MAKARRLIRTTPDTAFTYLSDLTRHGEWAINPGLEVVQTSFGAVMPGATFRSRGSQFGLKMEDELTVTVFEPPFRFGFEATGRKGPLVFESSNFLVRHLFEFEPAEGGTLVTKETNIIEGPRFYMLMKPITGFILSRRNAKDLKRIAKRLETDDG